jgi:hypothetical protein
LGDSVVDGGGGADEELSELIQEHANRENENKIEPGVPLAELREVMQNTERPSPPVGHWMYQPFDEDFQDLHRSDDIFEQAWGIAKQSEDDDDMFQDLEPISGFGQSNDAEKIGQIQEIFDDIERRKHEEAEALRAKAELAASQSEAPTCYDCGEELDDEAHWYWEGDDNFEENHPKYDEDEGGYYGVDPEFNDRCEDCHYQDLAGYVEEYEMEDYEGEPEDIWDNRWEISPPGGGWRMFSHGGSQDTNIPHLIGMGVDPAHIMVVNIGPREDTPWGYLSGDDTVWMSKESPLFDSIMGPYIEDEPEGYDPWERMS